MKNTPLAKFAALGGALLGIALKVNDFLRVKILRCGIGTANECGITDYLKDTLIWIVIMITLALIVVFGIKYLYIYGKDAWKSRKHTKHKPAKTVKKEHKKIVKNESKKENKESKKTEEKEEKKVIKI